MINNNAQTIPVYGDNGEELEEGSFTGFRRVSISTSGVLNGNNALAYSIKNPLVFIYNTNTSFADWYTNSSSYQNNNLWSSIKSTYDPCPQGWRVPPDSELTFGDFATGSAASGSEYTIAAGRIYNLMAWFPAAGYRHGGGGGLHSVGKGGHYWSASVSGTSANRLYFEMTYLGYIAYYRAYGFAVRCVQE